MSEDRPDKKPLDPKRQPVGEPSFFRIVETFAVPAMVWTGYAPNPLDEKAGPDLDLAKYHIGLLEVLERKTKGNLEKAEADFLAEMLHVTRLAFVRARDKLEEKPPEKTAQKSETEKKAEENSDENNPAAGKEET